MTAANCSAVAECGACAMTSGVCAWLADTDTATGICVRASASHSNIEAPYQLVHNATHCPVYATSAQLLFDPAMLVMLISICGALWLGARRSVSASRAAGQSNGGNGNGSNGGGPDGGTDSDAVPSVTQHMHAHLRDMRLTPKRVAAFLLVPLCGSAVLLLFYFFTTIVYYCLLVVTTLAGLSSLYQLLFPYCHALALRFAPVRASAPFQFARRRISLASIAACALSALAVALWLASNYWLFINLVALAVGVAALERAPIPAVRYTFLLGMLLVVYDCFWVFATILRPLADDDGAPPSTLMTQFANATTTGFTTVTASGWSGSLLSTVSLGTPLPTPAPTHAGESAMLRLAMGILHDSKGCELAVLALFRPCWPSLPMITVYPRWFVGGFSAVGLGDLIVPGVHIAVLARYDHWLKRTWRTGYFALGALGYCLGLVLTMVVALVFRSGQPALLYLIPFVHFPTLLAAAIRRELPLYWTGRRTLNADAASAATDNNNDNNNNKLVGAAEFEAANIETNAVPMMENPEASLLANVELRD